MSAEELLCLNITRSGSTWTRTAAYWAGQADDRLCQLCGEADETSDHFWWCAALKVARETADGELSKMDPDHLPAPVRHGIAPALVADVGGTFWGLECLDKFTLDQRKMCGWDKDAMSNEYVKQIAEKVGEGSGHTAREIVQCLAAPHCNSEQLPMPLTVSPPPCKEQLEKPNVYSDGSLHNPSSMHWRLGGIGVYWPGRCLRDSPLTEAEQRYTRSEEKP